MTTVTDRLKELKTWYRLHMNGVVSQSMRNKGLAYKIIWGISLPELTAYAQQHGKDHELAQLLWAEDIRESKILALMMMPPETMTHEKTKTWAHEIPNQEIAEIAAMKLFQHIKNAKEHALEWITDKSDIITICGYQTLSRLFMKGITLENNEFETFNTLAQKALNHNNLAVRHAAGNAINRLTENNTRQ